MANLLRKGNRFEPSISSTVRDPAPTQTYVPGSKKSADHEISPWDVTQIWIESVTKEDSTRKQWEQMYGWMADLDAKGNLKPKKRSLENCTRFSNTIPNSRGHDYGWHLQSELGQEINNLQTRFNNQHKKRQSTVILGYD